MNAAKKEVSREVKHLNFSSGRLQGLLLSDISLSETTFMLEITVKCCSKPTDLLYTYNYREKSLIFKSNGRTNRFFI